MPTKSGAQHRLMEAAAHDPAVAKKTGIPQSVGQELVSKDDRQERYLDAVKRGDSATMGSIFGGNK